MANLITIFRLILIPVFSVLLLSSYNIAATIVFGIMAFTDWLDGYVARRTKITEFGKVIDPVADRLVIIVATVLLAAKGMLPLPAMAILILREFMVIISVALLQIYGITIEVIIAGKYATAVVLVSIVLILLGMPFSKYFIYAAALFYFVVGVIYVYKTVILLKNKRRDA